MSINITVSNTNDFPSLGKKTTGTQTSGKRSSSALSSQSSASAGSRSPSVNSSVKTVIQNGDYYTVENAALRPFLRCFCETCGGEWVRECKWSTYCEKAFTVKKGTTVRVIESKVVHHKVGFEHERFSIALVSLDDPETQLEPSTHFLESIKRGWKNPKMPYSGWVMSKTLKVRGAIRSQSVLRNVAKFADRSRSRSVSVATSVASSVFQLGEAVLVQTETLEWKEAVVKCENPLRIQFVGQPETWWVHLDFIKKCPARKFVLTCDAKVRSLEHVDKWDHIATLKKGTVVSISHMSGYEGRVTAPVAGWITMRSKHRLNMVEQDWKFVEQQPTIIVKNIPSCFTGQKLKRALLNKARCNALNVIFQRKGDKVRAVIQVGYGAGCHLVERKSLEVFWGWNVTFKWDMAFLQNRAAQNLTSRR